MLRESHGRVLHCSTAFNWPDYLRKQNLLDTNLPGTGDLGVCTHPGGQLIVENYSWLAAGNDSSRDLANHRAHLSNPFPHY